MMFTYKELIEVAIGSPESGHVNFYALQVLLTCFAQRLEVIDEFVEQDDYMKTNVRFQRSLMSLGLKSRMHAGADAEEGAPAEPEGEASAEDEAPPAEDEEVPPSSEAQEAPPVAQEEEEVAAEAVAEPEPTEAAPEPEPPAASPSQEEASAPQPEPEPSHEPAHEPEHEVLAEEKSLEIKPDPRGSGASSRDKQTDTQLINSVMRLENRMAKMELLKEKSEAETKQFVTSLTGQVKITMKELDIVAHMLLDRKPNPDRIKVLRQMTKELRVLMGTVDEEISIRSSSNEVEGEQEGEHEELQEALPEESSTITEIEQVEDDDDNMGVSTLLYYSPSRMLTELLEFKSQFCVLNNKFNDLSTAFSKQDTQRLLGMITDLQTQVRELKLHQTSNQESSSTMQTRFNAVENQVNKLKQAATHLDNVKSDRAEVELLLAEKVDFQQLATKVSLEQLEDYKVKLEMMFCEVRHIVSVNEKSLLQIIDNLRMSLGIDALEIGLKDFREMIERKVHLVADALHKYMEMTNDDCAAAAGRVKVMQDLACLSCDTNCVMRTVERSKLPKLPTAKGSTGLGPIVTYELGQIRKSGVMGYYRKDEFPHSTSAWAKGVSGAPMVKCTQRHAGGTHTIYTAEEHLQKVVLSKKNCMEINPRC